MGILQHQVASLHPSTTKTALASLPLPQACYDMAQSPCMLGFQMVRVEYCNDFTLKIVNQLKCRWHFPLAAADVDHQEQEASTRQRACVDVYMDLVYFCGKSPILPLLALAQLELLYPSFGWFSYIQTANKLPVMRYFRCNVCKLQLAYEYFGQRPPFGKKTIALLENAYVIHDPFDADGSHLILGSHCSECGAAVCVDQKCSLFYVKRFCCQCCIARNEDFPTEVQKEIKKMKELNSKN
ncbi:Cysteine-rich DPF motif domain-containing protein 1 [Trichoplax sp. H2]|nr:Cysteine-rich DPF motif domain-containing protein 1 [Trichoplax sp. H2]|eukprot:RDD46073.1 Cysteine-rich DPF motif domain-containing protein 1 [Trichoplax sp. H2]